MNLSICFDENHHKPLIDLECDSGFLWRMSDDEKKRFLLTNNDIKKQSGLSLYEIVNNEKNNGAYFLKFMFTGPIKPFFKKKYENKEIKEIRKKIAIKLNIRRLNLLIESNKEYYDLFKSIKPDALKKSQIIVKNEIHWEIKFDESVYSKIEKHFTRLNIIFLEVSELDPFVQDDNFINLIIKDSADCLGI